MEEGARDLPLIEVELAMQLGAEAVFVAVMIWQQHGVSPGLLPLDIAVGAATVLLLPLLRVRLVPVGCLLALLAVVSAAATPISTDVRVAGHRYVRFPPAPDSAALLLCANQRTSMPAGMPTLIATTAAITTSTGTVMSLSAYGDANRRAPWLTRV